MGEQGKQKLMQLLIEAHSNEVALIQTLQAHIGLTERGSYRQLLESHRRETERHAELIQRRLTRLGHRQNLLQMGYGVVQNAVTSGVAMAKAPVDMVRGLGDTKEKMLRNARDEVMTEALEIATYDTIEHLARSIGDNETAELAAEIRVDEEAMLTALRKEIPVLTDLVVASQLQISERTDQEPWPGYDDETVDEITAKLEDASGSALITVAHYERKNKNRQTVLNATERELESN